MIRSVVYVSDLKFYMVEIPASVFLRFGLFFLLFTTGGAILESSQFISAHIWEDMSIGFCLNLYFCCAPSVVYSIHSQVTETCTSPLSSFLLYLIIKKCNSHLNLTFSRCTIETESYLYSRHTYRLHPEEVPTILFLSAKHHLSPPNRN